MLRPLEGKNTTTVHFSVMLNDINEIREGTLEAVMKASVWVSMHWKDERLAWSMGQYPVETIVIDPNKIWRPDIRLYNKSGWTTKSKLYCTTMVASGTTCRCGSLYIAYRPRVPSATWECPFRFGSWVYHGYQLDIYIHDEGMDLSQYADRVWGISGNQSSRKAITKKCCREPWPEIKYILRLIRR
ncbi:hypothetical protein LSH36_81g06052 [Paralvinella palmiformis]|uniref:Neurotransmitter-gated ion-channel ligand-binding domain-containing protein n=1 Tax=Paralvinella palmiformis TaxID=53620 RepID=A0AAD9NAR3_9ANNE|nr:hypothetical protein LSH36_81g06052 [Paralvinella palmiformis]